MAVPHGSKVIDIATGKSHNCVTTVNRKVKCWGNNDYLQLDVPAGIEGKVFQIFSGYYHTCTVLFDGQLVCWGRNDKGQINLKD